MTTEEKRMMQPAQEYIRKLQHKRNAGTEDCMPPRTFTTI